MDGPYRTLCCGAEEDGRPGGEGESGLRVPEKGSNEMCVETAFSPALFRLVQMPCEAKTLYMEKASVGWDLLRCS